MEKNNGSAEKNIKKLEKLKMKGLKTPSFIVSLTGKIHARQNKVIRGDDRKILSDWLEYKQKNFNSYNAAILKITGNSLLPLRTELAKREYMQSQQIKKLAMMKKEVENLHPMTIKEKRIQIDIQRDIEKLQNTCDKDNETIQALQLAIDEIEHKSFQLIQKTRERAESKMLIYLQGARIIVDEKTELIKEAIQEKKLYEQYCKCENKTVEREVD